MMNFNCKQKMMFMIWMELKLKEEGYGDDKGLIAYDLTTLFEATQNDFDEIYTGYVDTFPVSFQEFLEEEKEHLKDLKGGVE